MTTSWTRRGGACRTIIGAGTPMRRLTPTLTPAKELPAPARSKPVRERVLRFIGSEGFEASDEAEPAEVTSVRGLCWMRTRARNFVPEADYSQCFRASL